jgi:Ni/Fe-hydrogenase subunit HybB-like protein
MSSLPSTPRARQDHAPAPLGGELWTRATTTLGILVLVMLAVLAVRFVRGIGATTNLSDGYPWGIWIAFDVVCGSALAAGGFSVAFMTYVLNRGAYHPLVRPALLAALFGYVQAALSIVFDLGRFWNMWHMFWPSYIQVNSVLFEVAVCIASYTLVLGVEALPMVFERLGWSRARQRLQKVLFFFIALGVLLPTMHQSSLGSLLIVLGPQIHPLYQTRLLPALFLVSCVGMGLAAVTFEATLSSLAWNRPLERELLAKLMGIGRMLMALFLALRVIDLTVRGVWPLAFQRSVVTGAFWLEMLLFATPILLLWSPASRTNAQRLFVSALAMAGAGMTYRLSAYLIAYDTGAGWSYFPSLGELAVSAGLVAFEALAFIACVRMLPVLPRTTAKAPAPAPAE